MDTQNEHRAILFSFKRIEVLTFAVTQMSLEDIALSEKPVTKSFAIPFM
jgi:hypothetical protein